MKEGRKGRRKSKIKEGRKKGRVGGRKREIKEGRKEEERVKGRKDRKKKVK